MGAALSSIDRAVPSAAIRTVWLARPTTLPSRSTLVTGSSTSRRVSSLRIGKTAPSGWPVASGVVRPVNASATGLRYSTRPWASVAMTASPMLASVTRSRSSFSAASAACASARRRADRIAPPRRAMPAPTVR